MRTISTISFFLISLLILTQAGIAQNTSRDFALANQLFQKGEFEKAYEVLEPLVRQNPNSPAIFTQAARSLMELKRYNEADELFQEYAYITQQNINLSVLHAEVNHLMGELETAYSIWENTLERNKSNFQAYQLISASMVARKEYQKAIEIFLKARTVFNNPMIFLIETANAYIASGDYERAVGEFINQIEQYPNRADLIVRQLHRFSDEYLLDITILVVEERLTEQLLPVQVVTGYYELLLWLYRERELYQKAIRLAINIDQNLNDTNALFSIADELMGVQKFGLARQAYDYLIQQKNHPKYPHALLSIANLYKEWADFNESQNLSIQTEVDSLRNKSIDYYSLIIKSYPDSNFGIAAKIELAEIYLIHTGNRTEAELLINSVKSLPPDNYNIEHIHFLEGLLLLHSAEFVMARLSFNKAKNNRKQGDEQKYRYFLSLNDFFAGDFEYAKIQLRAIERQSTSFYANESVDLRNLIRKGMQKDSATTELIQLSKAKAAFFRADYTQSLSLIESTDYTLSALHFDFIQLKLNSLLRTNTTSAIQWLENSITTLANGPIHEFTLWNLIVISKNLTSNYNSTSTPISNMDYKTLLDKYISEYPMGFHSDQIRQFLNESAENQPL